MIIIVMGVSGSGKSTVGSLLAQELHWQFFDADDFHSDANRDKMKSGIPLTDEDRAEWLLTLRNLLIESALRNQSMVLACSALRQKYRDALRIDQAALHFVFLKGSFDQIQARMQRRKGHYMGADMLAGQFQTLEEPRDALVVDISESPGDVVDAIRAGMGL